MKIETTSEIIIIIIILIFVGGVMMGILTERAIEAKSNDYNDENVMINNFPIYNITIVGNDTNG